MNFQFIFCFAKTNFQISDQTLHFEFKNAWKTLANFNRSASGGEASKDQKQDFRIMLCLLNEIRTFFDENPDCEFWARPPFGFRARFRPQIFLENLRSKTRKICPFIWKKKIARKFKRNRRGNFSVLDFCDNKKAEGTKFSYVWIGNYQTLTQVFLVVEFPTLS